MQEPKAGVHEQAVKSASVDGAGRIVDPVAGMKKVGEKDNAARGGPWIAMQRPT